MAIFTNPGTAPNYLSRLRFASTYASKETKHWDRQEARLTLNGFKKTDELKLYKD